MDFFWPPLFLRINPVPSTTGSREAAVNKDFTFLGVSRRVKHFFASRKGFWLEEEKGGILKCCDDNECVHQKKFFARSRALAKDHNEPFAVFQQSCADLLLVTHPTSTTPPYAARRGSTSADIRFKYFVGIYVEVYEQKVIVVQMSDLSQKFFRMK